MSTLQHLAQAALARDGARDAIEYEGAWVSWGRLRTIADDVAHALRAASVPDSAPVAFIARNRPSAMAALLALIARERAISMIYPFQAAAGFARDLESIDAAALIADAEDFTAELRTALAARRMAGVALHAKAAALAADRGAALWDENPEAEPRIEILTSGTTGPPKRFAVSYDLIAKHFVANSTLVARAGGDPASAPPFLLYFPLGNITGLYSSLPMLMHGLRIVLLERFSLEAWRDYVVRWRPAHTGVPPSYVQQIVDADVPREDLASLRYLGTGAAPLDPAVQAAFEDKYDIPILLSYGATEFGGPVAAMTPDLHAAYGREKIGSVGKSVAGAEVRAVDPDSGAVLARGAEGLLEVISPRIGPHWIRTSDLGRVDAEGFVFISGRADGAIMRGGFKILPETVERALKQHSAIAEAAVVGVADERLGQVPAAAVRVHRGVAAAPSIAELEAHLRTLVLATHLPAKWRFVEAIPLTPSHKVDRRAVAALFQ
jgi:acyl-CoA synthetase (AMP-forming)/AMP-acid ligase II